MIYKVVVIDNVVCARRKTNIDKCKVKNIRILKQLTSATYVALVTSNYLNQLK